MSSIITLEPFTQQDFDRLIGWVTSEDLMVQFAGPQFTYPLTYLQLENYLLDTNRIVFRVVLVEPRTVIGHAEVYSQNKQVVKLGRILIGDPAARGKGYGQQIIKLLLNYAFNQLNATQAELNVYDWNESAIQCYLKSGFKINPKQLVNSCANKKKWNAIHMYIDKN